MSTEYRTQGAASPCSCIGSGLCKAVISLLWTHSSEPRRACYQLNDNPIADGEPFVGRPGAPHGPLLHRLHCVRGQEVDRAVLNAGDQAVRLGAVIRPPEWQQGQEQGRPRGRALGVIGTWFGGRGCTVITSHWQKSQVNRFSDCCLADFGARLPANQL